MTDALVGGYLIIGAVVAAAVGLLFGEVRREARISGVSLGYVVALTVFTWPLTLAVFGYWRVRYGRWPVVYTPPERDDEDGERSWR